MGIRKYKPTSPGRRGMSGDTFEDVTKDKPERSLIVELRKSGGRNAQGRITVRHRGGGNARQYRKIDFKREKHGIPAKVVAIEYDPNRSSRIALLTYADGEKRYIIAPLGLRVGDSVVSGPNAEVHLGNCLPLANMPLGTVVHCVEFRLGQGAQMARSAGSSVQLLAKEGDYATLRLPSGEMRKVRQSCYAVVGQVGNIDHSNIKLGKAGRKRHLGIRPTVRAARCLRATTRMAAAKAASPSASRGHAARGQAHVGQKDAQQQAQRSVHCPAPQQEATVGV